MAGKDKSTFRKGKERRKLLSEPEVRKVVETGKAGTYDRRSWSERRKKK